MTDELPTAPENPRAGWIYTGKKAPHFLSRILRVISVGLDPDRPENFGLEVLADSNFPATVGEERSLAASTLDSNYVRLG